MRAVLFEGTPEEFAEVEARFRAGADPALKTRSIVLSQTRPKAWLELDEEQCHRLATRVLERAPASLVEALSALAEAQDRSGKPTIEDWADHADRLPGELCGILAELARCASRAFIELFGCDNAPERVTLAVIVGALTVSLIMLAVRRGAQHFGRRSVAANADLSTRIVETLTHHRLVRAFGTEAYETDRFRAAADALRRALLRTELLRGVVTPATELLYVPLMFGVIVITPSGSTRK